jgi:hypothetical protein
MVLMKGRTHGICNIHVQWKTFRALYSIRFPGPIRDTESFAVELRTESVVLFDPVAGQVMDGVKKTDVARKIDFSCVRYD